MSFACHPRAALSIAIGLVGLVLGAVAFFQFRHAGTTPDPRKPHESATLVVTGAYRWSRNPMYLGDLVILAAWASWLANVAPFVFLPLFVAYLNRFQIALEERALEARFGAPYADYRRAVRRWL